MSKLTGWFPADVKPVRKGVYIASIFKSRFYRYWNGRWWSYGVYDMKEDARDFRFAIKYGTSKNQAEIKWRGLSSDPSKGKK